MSRGWSRRWMSDCEKRGYGGGVDPDDVGALDSHSTTMI